MIIHGFYHKETPCAERGGLEIAILLQSNQIFKYLKKMLMEKFLAESLGSKMHPPWRNGILSKTQFFKI